MDVEEDGADLPLRAVHNRMAPVWKIGLGLGEGAIGTCYVRGIGRKTIVDFSGLY